MAEREVVRESRPTDREVVVDERPPGRGPGGGLVALIVGVILVLLLGWFLINALGVMDRTTDGGDLDADVNIEQQDDTGGGDAGGDAEGEADADLDAGGDTGG